MSYTRLAILAVVAAFLVGAGDRPDAAAPAVTTREFIYDRAPFPSCHASTLAQSADGTVVAAWFGGRNEGAADVAIWTARLRDGKWSDPQRVTGATDAAGHAVPTWNPVLFQRPAGDLLLFYKAGPSPAKWWGMMTSSKDGGSTWAEPRRLPDGILGPIKNKPILLPGDRLLCPSSDESDGWQLKVEQTDDFGLHWHQSPPLNDGRTVRAIQPTFLDHGDGHVQLLCRTASDRIYQSWSADSGKTWGALQATDLPNPNSGIDAVQLRDGRSLLVYNPSSSTRHPIAVAVSADGKAWGDPVVLEDTDGPELSYPAVIQTADGLVHVTYTWKRTRIRHVVIDPARLK